MQTQTTTTISTQTTTPASSARTYLAVAGDDSHIFCAVSQEVARAIVQTRATDWRRWPSQDDRGNWECLRLVVAGSPKDGGWDLVEGDVAGYALYVARPSEEVRSTLAHARQRRIAVIEQEAGWGLRCVWCDEDGDSVVLHLTASGWRTERGRQVDDAEAWALAYVGTHAVRRAISEVAKEPGAVTDEDMRRALDVGYLDADDAARLRRMAEAYKRAPIEEIAEVLVAEQLRG